MPNIKDTVRKKLWGSSAGRCSICNISLTDGAIIGEECHIISSKPNGPRHIPNLEDYDNYKNLIILCANHHKEIDKDTEKYTIDELKRIKNKHERRIAENLDIKKKFEIFHKINSGNEIGNLLWGCHAFVANSIQHESVNTKVVKCKFEIEETIQSMLNLQDDINSQEKLSFHRELDKYIKELEKYNCSLYAYRKNDSYQGIKCPICSILIKYGKKDLYLCDEKENKIFSPTI